MGPVAENLHPSHMRIQRMYFFPELLITCIENIRKGVRNMVQSLSLYIQKNVPHSKNTVHNSLGKYKTNETNPKSRSQTDLKITIKDNLKIVDFLDITMDLKTGEHKSYMKPNNTPLYVHKQSNHPPNIIKTFQKASTEDHQTYHPMKTCSKKPYHHTKMP